MRLMTPQMPTTPPIAVTIVESAETAELKNSIKLSSYVLKMWIYEKLPADHAE